MNSLQMPLSGRIAAMLCLWVLVPRLHAEQHPALGLVLKVDAVRKTAVISCARIPGYMDAKKIRVRLHDRADLANAKPGAMMDFVLVASKDALFAESVRPHVYAGLEPDPFSARRLKLLAKASFGTAKPLAIGDVVPDFTLTGQEGNAVPLSRFRGKLIAVNFVYTRCALPNFCVRSTNNFADLQKRFQNRLKRDLVLITVTFDPVHDHPEALAAYARKWQADPAAWHFLTGSEAAIRRVCDLFGEDYFPDEGLMNHSLHTAIIDRHGRMVANLEGNEFTAEQLGDLVEAELESPSRQ